MSNHQINKPGVDFSTGSEKKRKKIEIDARPEARRRAALLAQQVIFSTANKLSHIVGLSFKHNLRENQRV